MKNNITIKENTENLTIVYKYADEYIEGVQEITFNRNSKITFGDFENTLELKNVIMKETDFVEKLEGKFNHSTLFYNSEESLIKDLTFIYTWLKAQQKKKGIA